LSEECLLDTRPSSKVIYFLFREKVIPEVEAINIRPFELQEIARLSDTLM
jgi:hypothetical protein